MLKGLLNGSVILAITGFVLICSSSPDVPKTAFSKAFDRVAIFTAKHSSSLLPNYNSFSKLYAAKNQPYQVSLISMHDYYNTIPSYGMFVR